MHDHWGNHSLDYADLCRQSERNITPLCLILCDPVDCSPLGSSVHEILQAGILEWIAIPFSIYSSLNWETGCHVFLLKET